MKFAVFETISCGHSCLKHKIYSIKYKRISAYVDNIYIRIRRMFMNTASIAIEAMCYLQ